MGIEGLRELKDLASTAGLREHHIARIS
jgi:hypothetical protein